MAGSGSHPVGLGYILRQWGRVGVLGFGGPPVHIAMFRKRLVEEDALIDGDEFEDSVAATGLLPGPASTQLSILSAWQLAGTRGALLGGAAFILPGLVAILALSTVFLADSPPEAVLAAGAGAGAAVGAIALRAGWDLAGPSLARAAARSRWMAYVLLGGLAAALLGAAVVVVLLACGFIELASRRPRGGRRQSGTGPGLHLWPLTIPAIAAISGGVGALIWVAFKVGALSYGGGFVIIPLMQADAVDGYGWMTDGEFLNAVALGQITPGPVVCTVAAVGYAAGGVWAGLLAALVAFAPSFGFVIGGASRFGRMRKDPRVRSFLDGAGPAAIGAIIGVSIPLASALAETWQYLVLVGALLALFPLRLSVVPALLLSATAGVAAVAAGAPVP